MKTWLSYLTALLCALATAFLFADSETALNVFSAASAFLLRTGTLVTIPLIVFSFTSATASIRKDRMGTRVSSSIIIWTLVTSILLPVVPLFVFCFSPVSFPVTSSAGSSGDIVKYYFNYAIAGNVNALRMINPFNTIATASGSLLPLIILSWIFGIFLKPSADTIRPAYAVMNSFSEVMHKIARFYTIYGYIIAYFALTDLFLSVYVEKTLIAVPLFLLLLLAVTLITLLLVLPLIFAVLVRFRKNPYKVIALSIASLVMALGASDTVSSIPLNISISRSSLGVQKRNSVTSTVFCSLFAKGGTACISTFLSLTLIRAMGGFLDTGTLVLIALSCTLASFISFTSLRFETAITTYAALKLLNISLYGAESALISLLMVTNGLSSLINAAIMALGAKYVSIRTETDSSLSYKDYL